MRQRKEGEGKDKGGERMECSEVKAGMREKEKEEKRERSKLRNDRMKRMKEAEENEIEGKGRDKN